MVLHREHQSRHLFSPDCSRELSRVLSVRENAVSVVHGSASFDKSESLTTI